MHHISDIRTTFEISDTRLLDALHDAKTEEEIMSGTSTQSGSGEQILFDPEHRNLIANIKTSCPVHSCPGLNTIQVLAKDENKPEGCCALHFFYYGEAVKEHDTIACFGLTGSKLLVLLSIILIICHWILNHSTVPSSVVISSGFFKICCPY